MTITMLAVAASLGACKAREIPARVECPPFVALGESRLDLDGARQAFARDELRRELRLREALEPGYLLRETRALVDQRAIDRGLVCFEDLYTVGRLLFEHEYSFADGLGSGPGRKRNTPFRRVHRDRFGGPETMSCTSCHWRGGLAGAGGLPDNSFVLGDGARVQSAEARNPPPLHGAGVVQALAQEMTRELQAQAAQVARVAQREGRAVTVVLTSKGVDFGRVTASRVGELDTSQISGVDADLVIKPFGWRGEFATLREFVSESTQVHLGIQSDDLLIANLGRAERLPLGEGGAHDPDEDGVTSELSAGQMTALIFYLAAQELPVAGVPEISPGASASAAGLPPSLRQELGERFAEGEFLFDEIGCSMCHTPTMILEDPIFRTRNQVTGAITEISLSEQAEHPRLVFDASLGGYSVRAFSDFKRHDLGAEAGGTRPGALGANTFLTRRLWGLAQSPPYFYDGRAPDLDGAIAGHGGEAQFAREGFEELGYAEKGSLRLYLVSLQRAERLIVP